MARLPATLRGFRKRALAVLAATPLPPPGVERYRLELRQLASGTRCTPTLWRVPRGGGPTDDAGASTRCWKPSRL